MPVLIPAVYVELLLVSYKSHHFFYDFYDVDLKRIIYVSCGYDALEQDTRQLTGSGQWKVSSANAFLLFPGSDHIESVVVFDRIANPPARVVTRANDLDSDDDEYDDE